MQMANEFYINFEVNFLLIAASSLDFLNKAFTIWNNIFFAIVWIDEFGIQCVNIQDENLVTHTKNCLKNYKSLQESLGIFHSLTLSLLA